MSQTNKIILIVVETTPQANTDGLYISKAIRQLYDIGNEIKIHYEYLKSKTKYEDSGNMKRIKNAVTNFAESHVVYCLDTDDVSASSKQNELNGKIEKFCENSGFDLIWFCRDIEEVFLHKQVENTKKVSEAKKFGAQTGIGSATTQTLSCDRITMRKSNFMLIFDKYLTRKQY